MKATDFGLPPGQAIFQGEYYYAMPQLMRSHVPWSTEDFMDARNGVFGHHPLWNNSVDTDFGIVGTKDKIYLIPRSIRLRTITPETELQFFGLALQVHDIEEAKSYARRDLILNRNLTEEEARAHPLWLDFAYGDQARLDNYVASAFHFGKDQFGYDEMLGIFLKEENECIERAVTLGRLKSKGHVYGNFLNYGALFVGVQNGIPQFRERNKPQIYFSLLEMSAAA